MSEEKEPGVDGCAIALLAVIAGWVIVTSTNVGCIKQRLDRLESLHKEELSNAEQK